MASDRAFLTVSALLFAVSAAATASWAVSMSAMGDMPMPGGWTMSMMWMRMPGETWLDLALSFLVMWTVMMAAMMLPALLPMLWRYREAIREAGATRIDRLTALAGMGYFSVWVALGIVVFPPGFALAEALMQAPVLARAMPVAAGAVLVVAGAVQFTGWKIHHLACCRKTPAPGSIAPANVRSALRYGVRLGLHCSQCCINLMAILPVLGVMDLRVMAAVTAGITLERLLPQSEEARRLVGIVIIGAGLTIIYKVSLIN